MGSGVGWRETGVLANSGVTAGAILTCREGGALAGAALAFATTGETVLGGDGGGAVLRLQGCRSRDGIAAAEAIGGGSGGED